MNNLQYFFDREADILYVSKGDPRADVESEEVGDGIIARLDPVTREIVGFTILNFLKRTEEGLPAVVLPFRVDLVSCLRSSRNKLASPFRHYRESGNPVFLVFPGFRLALAIASLAGMTANFCCEFRRHHTS